jgi:hypothetical protein
MGTTGIGSYRGTTNPSSLAVDEVCAAKERDDVAMTLPGALVSIAGRFGVAYRPSPTRFKGSDSFSYAVTSNGNYRGGAGLAAHVMVNVISE